MTENKPLVELPKTVKPSPDERTRGSKWDRSTERKTPGRRRSQRTAQIHPRLKQETAEEFSQICYERDVSAGALFEEIFQFWKQHKQQLTQS